MTAISRTCCGEASGAGEVGLPEGRRAQLPCAGSQARESPALGRGSSCRPPLPHPLGPRPQMSPCRPVSTCALCPGPRGLGSLHPLSRGYSGLPLHLEHSHHPGPVWVGPRLPSSSASTCPPFLCPACPHLVCLYGRAQSRPRKGCSFLRLRSQDQHPLLTPSRLANPPAQTPGLTAPAPGKSISSGPAVTRRAPRGRALPVWAPARNKCKAESVK